MFNIEIIIKDPKIEGFSKNIRIKLPEKDDDEVSNDEMDEDVHIFFLVLALYFSFLHIFIY